MCFFKHELLKTTLAPGTEPGTGGWASPGLICLATLAEVLPDGEEPRPSRTITSAGRGSLPGLGPQ